MDLSGLILNKNIGTYSPNSWSFAKNVTISTDGKAIFNEGGFDTVVTGIVGSIMGSIAIGNTTILFSTNGVVHNIGKLVGSTYTLIVSDPAFNFDLQYPVYGVATYNHKGEIVVCFIDDYNSPKILNIDKVPIFPGGVNGTTKLLNVPAEFTLAETFPTLKNPIVNSITVNDSGGNLLSGVYYAVIANVFDDESSTSWQEISNPIIVTDDAMLSGGITYDTYDGCVANTPTSKSITLNLTNLDTNFSKFKVGIISKLGGVVSAYETDILYYTGTTATLIITDTSSLFVSSYKEITNVNSIYTKARAIALVNDRVHLGNLTGLPVIDFQQYANDIVVNWYRGDTVSLNTIKNSYKDSSILYTKKQFKSNEVYALYIGLRLIKGGYYGVWTIPGRAVTGDDVSGEREIAVTTPFTTIATTPRKYQFLDTCSDLSANGTYGAMSAWENVNEVYPTGFADFAGQKVRHHKFPSLGQLEEYKDAVSTKGFIDTTTTPITTCPLGLKISNVVIPDALLEYVDGWEIFYAERTVNNMSIVGQDILFGDQWITASSNYLNIRLHAFDLMTNRIAALPNYLSRQLDFEVLLESARVLDNTYATDFITKTYVPGPALIDDKLIPITTKGYYPALTDGITYDNSKREDAFIVSVASAIINTTDHRFLADICSYKEDMYFGYQNQILVSTGIFNQITAPGTQATVNMYGGDTVISRYSYRLNYEDGASSRYYLPYIVAESVSIADLRHEGTVEGEVYYPKSVIADMYTPEAIALGNYWGYNNDYNSINNNVQPIIIYPNINLTSTHPNRIARSLPKQTESVALNWRIFLVTDYYELTSEKGYINSLTTATDKILYIATRYSLFIAKVKDTIDATTGVLTLKEGDLFDREPQEVIPDKLGYIGNTNRFSTFICKYGYFTIDSEKGKVYIINDTVEEIATDTVSEFLKLYLPTSTDDNPFTEIGLSAGYDDVNDRILITVNNRVAVNNYTSSSVTNNVIAIANKSYTISLNLKHKRWVAFHDYLINHYITTRTGILGIVNNGGVNSAGLTADIFSLNSTTVFCKYPTTIKNSFIDFIFDANTKAEELIENIAYDAEIKSGDITYWDKTLTKLMISTKQQCSGEITLGIQTWNNQLTTGNIKDVKGIWIINKFKDRSVSTNITFLDVEGDVVLTNLENEFVTSVIYGKKYIVSGILSAADYITYNSVNYTKNGDIIIPVSGVTAVTQVGLAKIKNFKYWYEMSNIITNFAVVRLKYDNSEQLKMKVNNIMLNVK